MKTSTTFAWFTAVCAGLTLGLYAIIPPYPENHLILQSLPGVANLFWLAFLGLMTWKLGCFIVARLRLLSIPQPKHNLIVESVAQVIATKHNLATNIRARVAELKGE